MEAEGVEALSDKSSAAAIVIDGDARWPAEELSAWGRGRSAAPATAARKLFTVFMQGSIRLSGRGEALNGRDGCTSR